MTALKQIVESGPDDIWITFHASYLYWCNLASGPVEQDEISKFRSLQGQWKNTNDQDQLLVNTQIPGALASLQGFRGTVCKVKEKDSLLRLLRGETSEVHQRVAEARLSLIREVEGALGKLHWRDFEILIDLLFRQSGWRRISVLGETMKLVDLVLEEPINKGKYQVQVKSEATTRDFENARDKFSAPGFQKLFFVVHKPGRGLSQECNTSAVELMLPPRLAEMIVDSGLVDWVLAKIR